MADDELTRLRARVATLEERVRWLEGVCVPALRSSGQMSLELARRIEETSPLEAPGP
jgi:hypothetical protein